MQQLVVNSKLQEIQSTLEKQLVQIQGKMATMEDKMSKAQKNFDSFHRREAERETAKMKEVKLVSDPLLTGIQDKKLKAPQDLASDIVRALHEKQEEERLKSSIHKLDQRLKKSKTVQQQKGQAGSAGNDKEN